jgi:DNA-binding NarL/FixJ family response regulator
MPAPARSSKHRILLVEDHPVTREGFAQLINYQTDLEVCGQTGSASKALASAETLKPDLIIVDISLTDSNGLELIKDLKSRFPKLPTLVLSTHDESLYAERAVRAGASGYVMKQAPTAAVMSAIREVLKGRLYLSEAIRSRLVQQQVQGSPANPTYGINSLSDRELEVFQLLGEGQATREIANRLHLSVSTVETYRAHIKQKLGLANAMELVHRAVEWSNSQRG